MTEQVKYQPGTQVDFVVIGAGGAGGIVAKELAEAGFQVVALEQGPFFHADDFEHDELKYELHGALVNDLKAQPQTFRKTGSEQATRRQAVMYGRCVGGGTVHFTGNYWRFREIDFIERGKLGAIAGASLEDWPITYADLEPYYTKGEWELGISGTPLPGESFRSKPYPLPPMPVKSSGVLFERGARKLGWSTAPAPIAVISQPYRGRNACQHCGYCEYFGCEFGSKSSSLAAMIPLALKTGRCEIRPKSVVARIEHDAEGRATGVVYYDERKRTQRQKARAIVLCANGVESARLLLLSASTRFPQGLANSSGFVGTNLMFTGGSFAGGWFEHELNEHKSIQVTRITQQWYDSDPQRGFYGGGGMDGRFNFYPISFGMAGLPPDAPRWGAAYKNALKEYYTRTMYVMGHCTSLPVPSNSVTLDPDLKDAWSLPAARITYRDHPDDLKMMQFLTDRSLEVLDAAGARQKWALPVEETTFGVHLLGTCRMGNDPRTSVVDRNHRAHDVKNLFIVDGSSFVTSGRGQPTCTIQALAFRAADLIAQSARRDEI